MPDLAQILPDHRSPRVKPITNAERVILNAAVLTSDHLAKKRVLCPGCARKVFERWPSGWDAHAVHECAGLEETDPERRKAEFKATFRGLFRA